jgi:hypothetical protein
MGALQPLLRFAAAGGSLALVLIVAGCSSNSNPTRPTPAPAAESLVHFEPLVGTNWVGTATYGSGGPASRVSIAFIWGGSCNNPPWCFAGYNPYGWGTVDDVRTRILGYNDDFTLGLYRRELYVGQPTQSTGRWDSAVLSGDRQHLVITSPDFTWGERRGVRIELSRAPWPDGFDCPEFRNCSLQ